MSGDAPEGGGPSPASPDWRKEIFLTVLGSGYAPFASGSWGSLASVLIYLAVWWAVRGVANDLALNAFMLLCITGSSVLAIRWGPWAIARWGRKDPKPFVLDEFAGQWIALLWLPPVALAGGWPFLTVVAGQFFWFRLFDVLKPPPARQIDRDWPGGWGIQCDDLVAGVYANLVGQAIWRLTPLAAWMGL